IDAQSDRADDVRQGVDEREADPAEADPVQRLGIEDGKADRQPDKADVDKRNTSDIDRPIVVSALEDVRVGELAEAARPQVLLDLVQHVDDQQAEPQCPLAQWVGAKKRDPSENAEYAQIGQSFLPIGSNAG